MGDDDTVGKWLHMFDFDRDAAWLRLQRVCKDQVSGPASRFRLAPEACDDVVSEALVRTFSDEAAAPRRAPAGTALGAWIHGVLWNIVREMRKARPWATLWSDEAARSAARKSFQKEIDVSLLTSKQAEALELFREGRTVAEIARRLHLSWSSAKDRLVRGLSRARTGKRLAAQKRSWARGLQPRDPQTARVVELYRAGASYRGIAEALGMTRAAVRGRLRRMRPIGRKSNQSASPPP